MKRINLYLLATGIILMAFAVCGVCAMRGDSPPPADICTGSYFYRDACGDWRVGWPGDGNATTQGNCAHGFMAKDNTDGVWYYIVGAGAGGTKYPKPRASAQYALDWWNKCFVDHDPSMSRTFPSCLQSGASGTWSPALVPLSSPLIPPAKKASWSASYGCVAPPPPTVTPAPTGKHPFADYIEGLYANGVTAGCGNGNFCPDREMTRGEVAVWLWNAMHNNQPPPTCVGIFKDVPCH